MHKHLLIGAILLGILAGSACQDYQKGVQEGVTRADETAAIGALHALSSAQQIYSTTNDGKYGTFEQLVASGNLDPRFKSDRPKVRGYVLTLAVSEQGGVGSYSVHADPEPPLAGRHLYMESGSGVIHVNDSATASATDPALN